MSEEDRLKLENELLLTKSKAQMINLYLDLQQKVEQKNKEIDRLNNIINGLEKWIKENNLGKYRTENVVDTDELLDKLKELKENNKDV